MMNETQDKLRDAHEARTELYETLALLSDRLNYAKRFDEAVDRTMERIDEEKEYNPLRFAIGVAAVAVAVGALAWVGTRKVLNTFW